MSNSMTHAGPKAAGTMSPGALDTHDLATAIVRPGISPATLVANGVRLILPPEAKMLCGIDRAGIWIPYHNLDSTPLCEENRAFGRLRLTGEKSDHRYHSPAGTRSHLYQPLGLAQLLMESVVSTLFLTEGEFKALSAYEHGIVAAGVSGICNAAPQNRLVDEFQLLLDRGPFNQVIYVGDSDVALNADFARAMVKLANALPEDIALAVIAPGLEAPGKGLDDQREKLGDAFEAYWERLVEAAISVPRDMPWEELAITLLRREAPAAIAAIINGQMPNGGCHQMKLKRHLFGLLNALKSSPLTQVAAAEFIGEASGIKPRILLKHAAAIARNGQAGEIEHDFTKVAENYVFDGLSYYRRNDDGITWGPRSRVDCLLDLEETHGLSRRAGREGGVSAAEHALNLIQRTREIDLAVELGGLPAGLHLLNGNRVLVPRERRPMAGVEGDATPIIEFIQNLLGKGIDALWERQYTQLLGWLKWWREALSGNGLHRPRQFIALVGPGGCGKTLLQEQITALVGGRAADAGLWLQGETSFNADMWAADHIVLSDTTLYARPGVRKSLRDKIKELVSNRFYAYHAKGKTLRTLPHLWGVSLSCNDDHASATIIPEIDASAAERFSYLRAYAPPFPFPSKGTPHGDAYWNALDSALPAFAHLVDSYIIPQEFAEPRWGVVAWRHPAIMELIRQANPDAELGSMLDRWLDQQEENVVGFTASQWFDLLELLHPSFRKTCYNPMLLGQALHRLSSAEGWSGRIVTTTVHAGENRQPTTLWQLTKALPL